MERALKEKTEWTRRAVFDSNGKVLSMEGSISIQDLKGYLTAFNDKDTTFGNGFNIDGKNYEVHRFYEDDGLIYGRTHSVDPRDGEGFCFARAKRGTTGEWIYAIITYKFPVLSAKAVPELQDFMRQFVCNQ
ncbi:hypothetical protein GUITHDRAFT_152952 [Guillardia theta CCMP2712]|uniref:Profilin n=1 Tax=Guillardia theta (strain CCMP2712) TaxID=905079 RepID=L1J865_GUITC|nr:hypothetical protein GUITHDRAFT_152952 [Guillardia theta CCMP2712]EKX44733.1 hypothetical protein GUITHDRAFT_152952 [Guillardia theta CCMP2712]|eukprot:XP_005831713.1 hypothetical protein GUITHDRAFT_152952 [Guillardia theta CCMP2712]